jgi:hypothetical protein
MLDEEVRLRRKEEEEDRNGTGNARAVALEHFDAAPHPLCFRLGGLCTSRYTVTHITAGALLRAFNGCCLSLCSDLFQ